MDAYIIANSSSLPRLPLGMANALNFALISPRESITTSSICLKVWFNSFIYVPLADYKC